jgi:hypothetical protein
MALKAWIVMSKDGITNILTTNQDQKLRLEETFFEVITIDSIVLINK